MLFAGCSVPERFVNPLFEVFDGGDLILSSYCDVERPEAQMRVYFEGASRREEARRALEDALSIVGSGAKVEMGELPDEDWKYAYRRHFKTELIGRRLAVVPAWEKPPRGRRVSVVIDPGMAFGTGGHETTRACLEYIEALSGELEGAAFLDMGCGSGILSIAAAKLGFGRVEGFDVDPCAVAAAQENAARNGVSVPYRRFALGRRNPERPRRRSDLVVANILGPLLVRFADEICAYVGGRLVISGILDTIYPEVLAAYVSRGFTEISRTTKGEWTTGLLAADAVIPAHMAVPGVGKATRRDALAVVVVPEQRMVVSACGRTRSFRVSTAAAGVGSEAGSYMTPPGWHRVSSRIGARAAKGQLFVSRKQVRGAVRSGNALRSTSGDEILSRIFWLDGLEPGVNKDKTGRHDSYLRHIYIHGTNQEQLLGTPASHGCIRMGNDDVVELFDLVKPCANFYVYISRTN